MGRIRQQGREIRFVRMIGMASPDVFSYAILCVDPESKAASISRIFPEYRF